MQRMIAEITRLAWEIESGIRELIRGSTDSNESNHSPDSIESVCHDGKLERIEWKIDRVEAQVSVISDFLRRAFSHTQVPFVIEKPSRSQMQSGAPGPAGLSRQERCALNACLAADGLTYEELGSRLGISGISAKNLVNRMLRDPEKRRLFRKDMSSGRVKLRVTPEAKKQSPANPGEGPHDRRKRREWPMAAPVRA
jgi:hypothetical protein